jgi:hypothetical protein
MMPEKNPERALSQMAGNRKLIPKSRASSRGQQQLGYRLLGSVACQRRGHDLWPRLIA